MNKNIAVIIYVLLAAAFGAFAGLFFLASGNETVGLYLMAGAVTVALLTFLIPTHKARKDIRHGNRS